MSWSSSFTLTLNAARNIAINSAITATNGGLTLSAANAISGSDAVNVGRFTLQSGAWSQNTASLPSFSATDFTLGGGSFLRVTGGDGSGSPYQIADIYGLQGIGSSTALLSDSDVLANSIDATGTSGWNSGAGFAPIGSYNQFQGTFDGQGHTISNLTIDLPSADKVGLFGGSGGTIKNVGLIGGSVSGNNTVGALVGLNAGPIDMSYATTAVNGGANGQRIGGLVGDNLNATITNSYATGAVSGGAGSQYVGGFVGQNDIGGTISDSYATGVVSGGSHVGGLVGSSFLATTTNSYWDTETSGQSSSADGTRHDHGAIAGHAADRLRQRGVGHGQRPLSLFALAVSGSGGHPRRFRARPTAIQRCDGAERGAVSLLVDGSAQGTVIDRRQRLLLFPRSTGHDLGCGSAVLAYETGANSGARLDTLTGTTSGFDIWGSTLIAPTSRTAYSDANANFMADNAALIAQAVGANTDPTTGLANYGYIASGGFTIDQALTLSNGLYLKSAGDITVADALTLPGSNGLMLDASGALAVNAPITVSGAGAVSLAYDGSDPANLQLRADLDRLHWQDRFRRRPDYLQRRPRRSTARAIR